MSGAAVGCPREGIRCRFPNRYEGERIVSAAIAMPGNTAATFLIHFFGPGLADDRYAVEKFRALADGNIRRCPDPAPKGGRRRTAQAATATLKAVREMRPARTEIIVCTGLKTRGGVQIWGDIASGLFHDRRQKG